MKYLLPLLITFFPSGFLSTQQIQPHHLSGQAQGTTWHITYYHTDSLIQPSQIDSILAVIDSSLSIYKPYSLISRFNASPQGLTVDAHFSKVIQESLETYRQTNGIFDVTIQPLVQAWGFSAKKMNSLPDSATIRLLRNCVDSRYLSFQNQQLIKSKPCVTIDVNGIAQGYSVDVLASFLEQQGIKDFIVELGGEIRVKGRRQPGGERMKIGIEAPGEDPFQLSMMQRIITIDSGAITTSGNYRRFYESQGKKISHIIDPRTGYPAQNELISVTVYANNAITADAFDNALMVMGLQQAFAFVQARTNLAAYFIYRTPDGRIADTATRSFKQFFQ